ncbi:hypothetical protein RHGRI_004515 [Rhododendron griersonianum]|uniref:Uncharacterized protein n=1 Tax=Rhododendron griersonianum TaxID=479676 RepID=A0AAV6LBW2_9ERIC|nr:hypothetical protein RHGRI_004515 [Rhododendron griersonianum]
MSASDPVTCVFASTTRDHPIHLWDATSGEVLYYISHCFFPQSYEDASYRCNSQKMVTIYILGGERIYRSSENTNQRIAFDVEPSGQHLGTGGQVLLMVWFIFIISKRGSGYQASKLHWVLLIDNSICQRFSYLSGISIPLLYLLSCSFFVFSFFLLQCLSKLQ